MNHNRVVWVGMVTLFLFGGLLLGQHFSSSPSHGSGDSFRLWLWEDRGLDLLVQAGLILAGALGIAALLPRGKEDE